PNGPPVAGTMIVARPRRTKSSPSCRISSSVGGSPRRLGASTARSNRAWSAASRSVWSWSRVSTKTYAATPSTIAVRTTSATMVSVSRPRTPLSMSARQRVNVLARQCATTSARCLVAGAANGLDELRGGGVSLDLCPQALDRDIHETRVAEVVVAPHPVEEDVARQDLAGGASELQ